MNVTTHIIVGTLPDPANLTTDRAVPSALPPHPFAARIPFHTHTAVAKPSRKPDKLTFRSALEFSADPIVIERQNRKGDNPDESAGGFDDASCMSHEHLPRLRDMIERNGSNDLAAHILSSNLGYQFLDEKDKASRIGLAAVTFLSDLGRNTPNLLPKGDRPGDRYVGVGTTFRVIRWCY